MQVPRRERGPLPPRRLQLRQGLHVLPQPGVRRQAQEAQDRPDHQKRLARPQNPKRHRTHRRDPEERRRQEGQPREQARRRDVGDRQRQRDLLLILSNVYAEGHQGYFLWGG